MASRSAAEAPDVEGTEVSEEEGPKAPTTDNLCLFFKNIVIVVLSIIAIVAFYDRFDRTKQTFLRLHTQIVVPYPRVEPSPCGLPTPSPVELGFAVGRNQRSPWDSDPTEADAFDQIHSSVCGQSNMYETVSYTHLTLPTILLV